MKRSDATRLVALLALLVAGCPGSGSGAEIESEPFCELTAWSDDVGDFVYYPAFRHFYRMEGGRAVEDWLVLHDGTEIRDAAQVDRVIGEWLVVVARPGAGCAIPGDFFGWWWWDWRDGRYFFVDSP